MKCTSIRWGAIVLGVVLALASPAAAEVETGPTRYASIRGDEAAAYGSIARVREDAPSRRVPGWAFVELTGEVEEIDGRRYARTDQGWIAEDALRRLVAPDFTGIALTSDTPIGWVMPRGRARTAVVTAAPSRRAAKVREASRREPVTILEERNGFVRIADGQWLPATQVRVARFAEPPRGLSSSARWIDVDLDQQTLVAYQGDTPVFATLISSGKRRRGTPTGVYRIRYKIEEARLRSRRESDERWDIEDVPYVMKFRERFALHGVYWHDQFGHRYSHGCVNLSPRDAQWIYRWSSASRSGRGTAVRIRNRRDPTPSWRDFKGERLKRSRE